MIVAQVHVATSVVPIQSEIQFPHERATCLTSQLLHFTCISSLASCLLRPTRISAAFSVSLYPPQRNFWPKILHFISNLINQVYMNLLIVHMYVQDKFTISAVTQNEQLDFLGHNMHIMSLIIRKLDRNACQQIGVRNMFHQENVGNLAIVST